MKTINYYLNKLIIAIPIAVLLYSFQMSSQEFNISTYQFKSVSDDQMKEFIETETKYWTNVAENDRENGNFFFCGMFQKVGGFDMPNSPNILVINTFKNIDGVETRWNPSEIYYEVSMGDIELTSSQCDYFAGRIGIRQFLPYLSPGAGY